MKTLSITAFMLLPLFADAIATWKGFGVFLVILVAVYGLYKYTDRKVNEWEREKENKEFDESEMYK